MLGVLNRVTICLEYMLNPWTEFFALSNSIPAKEREEFADLLLNVRDKTPLQPGERDPFGDWQE